MPFPRLLVAGGVLGLLLAVAGCSERNPEAPSSGKTHPASWVLDHGREARAAIEGCRSCHGADLRGQGGAPGCYSCHFDPAGARIPAGSTVVHGTIAHAGLVDDGAVCNRCHQLLRQAGRGPDNCHDCHVGADHPTGQGWLDSKSGTFHGRAAQQGTAPCSRCHGADLKGGASGVGCDSCHFGPGGSRIPAGSAWVHGTVPHGDLAPGVAICSACHTLNRMYGNGPTACHDCHVGATHPLGQAWLDRKVAGYHGAVVLQQGTGSCTPCHGSDLAGGVSGVGCATCHFGPDGSKVPTGAVWTHGTTPHGTLTASAGICTICHQTSRLYGNGPAPCHDCHLAATHALGQAWVDKKSAGYHGSVVNQQGSASCQPCHGADLLGGSSGVGCSSCHFGPNGSKVPSGANWQHGTSPHAAFADQVAVCDACHNRNRLYGNGPAACHDCHTAPPHALGRNWLDASVAGYHGAAAPQNITLCQGCHGSDLQGGGSGIGCGGCHFGPDGSRVPPGTGWSHGTVPHNQLAAGIAVCNGCHQLEREYGHGPAPCHDCHVGVSHAVGQPWVDPKSATFHGPVALQNPDSCKPCHGGDFAGGPSGVGCFSCHFGPTGSRVPAGSAWTHGAVPHGQFGASIAVCNTCHERNRLYGNPPVACHDCHVGANHPLGQPWVDFKSATFHGIAAQQNADPCKSCHGSDFKGGVSGVSCSRCHFGPTGTRIPPGEVWAHGSVPHGTLLPYLAVCGACHERNRLYGNGPRTCHDCHLAATHPLGEAWLDKTVAGYHGTAARAGLDQCRDCHGRDLLGGPSGVGCQGCHFDALGSRIPPGSSWSHGLAAHGTFAAAQAQCSACHSTNRLYGNPPAACHDCHLAANHPLGQGWLDKKGAGYHGSVAQTAIDSCRQCHGADLAGGASGVGCHGCHFGPTGSRSPSGSGWLHGLTAHGTQSAQQAVCNQCHATDRLYGNPPAACHDCHLAADHPLDQPWLDRKAAGYHGVVAQAGIDRCQQCHGADYAGGGSGVGCFGCHFGPSGSKVPAGVTWSHGASHTTLGGYEAVCNLCHTTSRAFANGPVACHDCHASHATGADWLLPTAHATASIADRASCLSCHGMATGSAATPACRDCHTAADPPLATGQCTSCHGRPPGGTLFPNRNRQHGKHSGATCGTCHSGFGTGTLGHWYPAPAQPADTTFSLTPPDTMNYTLGRCTGNCHIGGSSKNHSSLAW